MSQRGSWGWASILKVAAIPLSWRVAAQWPMYRYLTMLVDMASSRSVDDLPGFNRGTGALLGYPLETAPQTLSPEFQHRVLGFGRGPPCIRV